MKFLASVLLAISCLFTITQSKLTTTPWTKGEDIDLFYGCKYAVSTQAYYCKNDWKRSFPCQCVDIVAQSAYFYCAVEESNNSTSTLKRFVKKLNTQCASYNQTFSVEKVRTIYDNATHYIKTPAEYGNFTLKNILRTPIKYNHTIYEYGAVTYYRRYQNEYYGVNFGLTQLAYWFFIAIVGACHQLLTRFCPSVNKNAKLQKMINGAWMKRYKQPFRIFGFELGFIPNKIESLVIAGSFIIFMVGCCWGYKFHPNDTFWAYKSWQITRYISDRTGLIACFAMNLTFLFAGRNNFFLWATGWNFASFMMYHKFVARCTVLLVFVHTIGFTWLTISMDLYDVRHILDYWRYGAVATTCGMIMLVFSSHIFRKRLYDIFLVAHIILAVFFMVGSWFHLLHFGLQYYCYSAIGVWSLDRLLRYVRMFLLFGGFRKNKITIIKNPYGKELSGTEEVDKDDLFFRIDIDNYNKSLFNIKDGNFSFLYILHPRGFWQSHPFTMVKVKESEDFTIIVKVKKGLTKHVYNSIAKSGKESQYYRICVEGPYGMTKSDVVSQFDNLSCVAIGTGVSGPLCYLNHHRNSEMNEKSGAQNVLHWGVRSMAVVEAYKQELTQLASKGNVKINIYCNRMKGYSPRQDSNSPSSGSVSEEKVDTIANSSALSITDDVLGLDNVELITEYMCVEEVVNRDMDESSSLVVMTCGYPIICDETRYQFLKTLDSKNGDYQLIDDSQVW
ncbi:hypothetical protein ACO0SA_003922 [Hanseniaspora valbyensis]